MSGNEQSRLVLFPYGSVTDPQLREIFNALLYRHCGADSMRWFDTKFPTQKAFIRYASRMAALQNEHTRALIVVTETYPLVLKVVNLRREMLRTKVADTDGVEQGPFVNLLWILFVDLEQDPFFEGQAKALGVLDADLDDAPIWLDNTHGDRYLVLTPKTTDGMKIQASVRRLTHGSTASFRAPRR